MARVTVFVDSVVRGDLPMVCAKTGEPAVSKALVRSTTRSPGLAWLLVFFGPPGWVALAVILWIGGEQLEGRVPMSQEAWDRICRRTRGAWIAAGAAVACLVLAVALQFPGLGVLAVAALVVAVVSTIGTNLATVELSLDASRRWVTISSVHPDFAAAVVTDSALPAHHASL